LDTKYSYFSKRCCEGGKFKTSNGKNPFFLTSVRVDELALYPPARDIEFPVDPAVGGGGPTVALKQEKQV
jgi:hypothetical protein